MKENQLFLKWEKRNEKLFEAKLPENIDFSSLSVYRITSKKELKTPFNPIFGSNCVTLDIGHDFRKEKNFFVSSNLDIVVDPILIEWGNEVEIICVNKHACPSRSRFCPECGEALF